jgi:hypothetical protein
VRAQQEIRHMVPVPALNRGDQPARLRIIKATSGRSPPVAERASSTWLSYTTWLAMVAANSCTKGAFARAETGRPARRGLCRANIEFGSLTREFKRPGDAH